MSGNLKEKPPIIEPPPQKPPATMSFPNAAKARSSRHKTNSQLESMLGSLGGVTKNESDVCESSGSIFGIKNELCNLHISQSGEDGILPAQSRSSARKDGTGINDYMEAILEPRMKPPEASSSSSSAKGRSSRHDTNKSLQSMLGSIGGVTKKESEVCESSGSIFGIKNELCNLHISQSGEDGILPSQSRSSARKDGTGINDYMEAILEPRMKLPETMSFPNSAKARSSRHTTNPQLQSMLGSLGGEFSGSTYDDTWRTVSCQASSETFSYMNNNNEDNIWSGNSGSNNNVTRPDMDNFARSLAEACKSQGITENINLELVNEMLSKMSATNYATNKTTWHTVDKFIEPVVAYHKLKQSLYDNNPAPPYKGLTSFSFAKYHFGVYGIFSTHNYDESDDTLQLRTSMPMWNTVFSEEGWNLSVRRQSSDCFFKDVYIITDLSSTAYSKVIVAWYRNDFVVHYTNDLKFVQPETVVEMLLKCKPSVSIPQILLGSDRFRNYAVVADKNHFTLDELKKHDEGVWTCASRKKRTRTRTVKLSDAFLLHGIENKHAILNLYRRIHVIVTNDKKKQPVSNLMLYYCLCDSFFDLDVFKRRDTNRRLCASDVETIREAYKGREAADVLKIVREKGINVTKKQILSQRKHVPSSKRGNGGRRFELDARQLVDLAAIATEDGKVVLQKNRKGDITIDGYFVFRRMLILALHQATSISELENHIQLCEELESFGNDKRGKYEFLRKMFMDRADSGCYLPVATPMQCDTSFDLSSMSFTFVMMGIRGYRHVKGGKIAMVPVSMMLHLERDLPAHEAHREKFEATIKELKKELPYLSDKIVTLFTTDGERNLAVHMKLSICKYAKHLGCAVHLRKNLEYAGVSDEAIQLAFGTKINENDFDLPVIREGLLMSFDETEYYEKLCKLEPKISEDDFYGIISRDDRICEQFTMGPKLRGGSCAQFLTTNNCENFNGYLKNLMPGRHPPQDVVSMVQQIVEARYEGYIRAATIGDDTYKCDVRLTDWHKLSPSQKTAALRERGLDEGVNIALKKLNPSFIRDVGILFLNEAIRQRTNFEITPNAAGFCVRNLKSKNAAELKQVSIKRFIYDENESMELDCTALVCARAIFCIHKVQVLLHLPSCDQEMVANYHVDSATLRKALKLRGGDLRGYKPGKRLFSWRSKNNGNKNSAAVDVDSGSSDDEFNIDSDLDNDETPMNSGVNDAVPLMEKTPADKCRIPRDRDNLSARILRDLRSKKNKNADVGRDVVNRVLAMKKRAFTAMKKTRARKKKKLASADQDETMEDHSLLEDLLCDIESGLEVTKKPPRKKATKTTAPKKAVAKKVPSARGKKNVSFGNTSVFTDSSFEERLRYDQCSFNDTDVLPTRNRFNDLSESQQERYAATYPQKYSEMVCKSSHPSNKQQSVADQGSDGLLTKWRGNNDHPSMGVKESDETPAKRKPGRPPNQKKCVAGQGIVASLTMSSSNNDHTSLTPEENVSFENTSVFTDSSFEERLRYDQCSFNDTDVLPTRNRFNDLSESQQERYAATYPQKYSEMACKSSHPSNKQQSVADQGSAGLLTKWRGNNDHPSMGVKESDETPAKRKRGRPPTQKKCVAGQGIVASLTTSSSKNDEPTMGPRAVESDATPAKRLPGRPPKIKKGADVQEMVDSPTKPSYNLPSMSNRVVGITKRKRVNSADPFKKPRLPTGKK